MLNDSRKMKFQNNYLPRRWGSRFGCRNRGALRPICRSGKLYRVCVPEFNINNIIEIQNDNYVDKY